MGQSDCFFSTRLQYRAWSHLGYRALNALIFLMLVDDHAAFRKPLALVLEREPDLVVAAQAGSLAEARALLARGIDRVDVALIDLHLPDGDGIEIMRDVRRYHPRGRIVVLTAVIDRAHHGRAIDAGAAAILSKAAHPAELVASVRRAAFTEQPAQSSQ